MIYEYITKKGERQQTVVYNLPLNINITYSYTCIDVLSKKTHNNLVSMYLKTQTKIRYIYIHLNQGSKRNYSHIHIHRLIHSLKSYNYYCNNNML